MWQPCSIALDGAKMWHALELSALYFTLTSLNSDDKSKIDGSVRRGKHWRWRKILQRIRTAFNLAVLVWAWRERQRKLKCPRVEHWLYLYRVENSGLSQWSSRILTVKDESVWLCYRINSLEKILSVFYPTNQNSPSVFLVTPGRLRWPWRGSFYLKVVLQSSELF